MKLWIMVLTGVLSGATILLLLSLFLFLRCRRRPHPPSIATTTASFSETEAKYREEPFQFVESEIAKLHPTHKSRSSKPSLRFHPLHNHHHHHHHHHQKQQQPLPPQLPPFNWDDHPDLITEAVEFGWSRFAFTSIHRSPAPRSTPLLGLCAACDAGSKHDSGETDWEVPPGSSEYMQTVRINPGTKRSNSSSSPLPSADEASASAGGIVRMGLPLPGPFLGGTSFPKDAYFEITILYIQPQKPRPHRSSKRSRDGESDRTKLIQVQSIDIQSDSSPKIPLHDSKSSKDEAGKHSSSSHVVSLGLTLGDISSNRWTPGTYPGSIGFNSNGSVHLDGMKLVFETERAAWAVVNRVVGCGFKPSKKKVFLTVDGELVQVIQCHSDAYRSPMYPVVAAARADVMLLVNLGQRAFAYTPANTQRTPNPCFVRSTPEDVAAAAFGGFVDSRELFSVGRSNSGSVAGDAESDLFEIALQS